MMAMRSYSVAEAKNSLPELVHEAEVAPVEISRRGKVVVVVMSKERYDRLNPPKESLWEFVEQFRQTLTKETASLKSTFAAVRDRSPGRDIKFDE